MPHARTIIEQILKEAQPAEPRVLPRFYTSLPKSEVDELAGKLGLTMSLARYADQLKSWRGFILPVICKDRRRTFHILARYARELDRFKLETQAAKYCGDEDGTSRWPHLKA